MKECVLLGLKFAGGVQDGVPAMKETRSRFGGESGLLAARCRWFLRRSQCSVRGSLSGVLAATRIPRSDDCWFVLLVHEAGCCF
jgi:hypothetical protein